MQKGDLKKQAVHTFLSRNGINMPDEQVEKLKQVIYGVENDGGDLEDSVSEASSMYQSMLKHGVMIFPGSVNDLDNSLAKVTACIQVANYILSVVIQLIEVSPKAALALAKDLRSFGYTLTGSFSELEDNLDNAINEIESSNGKKEDDED